MLSVDEMDDEPDVDAHADDEELLDRVAVAQRVDSDVGDMDCVGLIDGVVEEVRHSVAVGETVPVKIGVEDTDRVIDTDGDEDEDNRDDSVIVCVGEAVEQGLDDAADDAVYETDEVDDELVVALVLGDAVDSREEDGDKDSEIVAVAELDALRQREADDD